MIHDSSFIWFMSFFEMVLRMVSLMFRFILKQFKIFNSIIISFMVNMVYNFTRFKIATKMFFHNIISFRNIPKFISFWVSMNKDINISFFSFKLTAFPFRMLRTNTMSPIAFYRTKFSLGVPIFQRSSLFLIDSFTTIKTFSGFHNKNIITNNLKSGLL